ncbi:putative matrin/U1-C-like, C2H2-type zinc finger, Zinc finger C2H2 superfamily [Helianthus annuus]|nr:putative matrin/U1-C-like, C2H2-type zinc finger, Zinc finger C2H2 superfamily [Helianthus annuus]KAJ0574643.1 putative matrin/U1-C-like, C2H2-type zinc finger, Zinc finger C2H2 superfamily [Helianthus annuus]KAJ0738972.1 putative matrin/U1-C-like, C2H2-type zinc finger, Zinc finger C2H2 superfamily [Helianthus annuus]KAJ0741840.1 putative matrin/U1-C-like, C2H2-type zinc finger, Zinc finger C2H2 superfamily [Helianthus annuus]
MPLGKYYCDYCDKQFQDTPFHRKRHLQGLHHQKAKALWYASVPPGFCTAIYYRCLQSIHPDGNCFVHSVEICTPPV